MAFKGLRLTWEELSDKGRRPWHYWTKDTPPGQKTLEVWRRFATRLAQEKGARWACGLCKRPIGLVKGRGGQPRGQYGLLQVSVPGGYRLKPRRRKICYVCAWNLMAYLEMLEWEGKMDGEEPEVLK